MTTQENVNPSEINKFSEKAQRWWDPHGDLKTLHQVNPLRIRFIDRHTEIRGKRVVDIGCGGGILSEGLAKENADVLGIDLSKELIDIADLHGLESGIKVQYQFISAEALAEQQPEHFDFITCMEMLEHVPDPEAVVKACSRLLKSNGKVFFSTLNRKPKSFLMAIVAAEYILRMIPKGTHDYKSFIKPSELCAWARKANLSISDIIGISYNPVTQKFSLSNDQDVNYIAVFQKS